MRLLLLLVAGCLLLGGLVEAQAPNVRPPQVVSARQYETRDGLERAAQLADDQKRTSQSWLLRARLQNGDFQEGDRIVIGLETNPRPDTLQVRAGKILQFAGMADLSLHGVLRSELTDAVRTHLARYLRNPNVRATPLVAIAVLGQVGAPGYHYAAADVLLRDMVMKAGGPAGNADLTKVTIKRAGQTIWDVDDVQVALAEGLSLDKLHLRAGDEIHVPERRRVQWSTVLAMVSSAVALTATVIQLQSR